MPYLCSMKLEFEHLIPAEFHASSKVWIYQSSRLFTIGEALEIEDLLNNFVAEWKSHGASVKGYANLLFGQFIVLMADETATGVSGCSTDSSVYLIKKIEELFHVELFNRQHLAFVVKEKIQVLPLSQINYAFDNNFVNPNTLYFNNLVANKQELLNHWIIPAKQSWLANRFKVLQSV